jgi:ferredoxin
MVSDYLARLARHLPRFSSADWERALDALDAVIHRIDRNATRIWFAFYPLDLFLLIEAAGDAGRPALVHRLGLMGRWRLADLIDTSHRFLYAHRYWPQVKSAVAAERELPDQLAALITAVADGASRTARVDRELLLGISAVGLMTLRQVGAEAFDAAEGRVHLTPEIRRRTPHQVMRRRARDDWQGPFGFLRGPNKRWTVIFDENDPEATFAVRHEQEIASAARNDKRDYRSNDPRCIPREGPIPVECRAASCGTCWVGVLGGAEKLSPMSDRDERRPLSSFGYLDTDEPQPIIRLACQARATGRVAIVIPPWNGKFGPALAKKPD